MDFVFRTSSLRTIHDQVTEINCALNYSCDNLPFLLQYEYYSIAWGSRHEGYFIEPNGNVLSYKDPRNWNHYKSDEEYSSNTFWGYETDGRICPKSLFENLDGLKKQSSNSGITTLNMNAEMLQDLMESEFEYGNGRCDAGVYSHAMIVFDKTSGSYKRIVLKTTGEKILTNKSAFTAKLLNCFIKR
jgi:hypothetical protein